MPLLTRPLPTPPRRCGRCKTFKPVTDFHIVKGQPARWCRACRNACDRERYRESHPERPRAPAGTKFCPRCKITKLLNEFSRSRSQATGRQGQCKDCRRDMERDRRAVVRLQSAAATNASA